LEENQNQLLLDRLQPVRSAFHDSNEAALPCLPGTRTKLLADVAIWMKDPSAVSIYWLTGAAGTGKTTVAQSVADMAKEHGCLGASFFFSRTDESAQRRRAVTVIPTISYQLARKLNMFRTALCQAVTSEPDICTSGLAKQAEVLLSRTFRVVSNASDLPLVVVIDALDECEKDPRSGREGGDLIPTLIKTFQDAAPLCVKLFVTSRPERTIENMFSHRLISGFTTALSLHLDIEQEIVRDDIVLYLRHELDRLADERSIPPPFPSEAEFSTLVDRAGVLFIYVRTVVMYVSSAVREPLEQVADLIRSDSSNVTEKFAFLDALYIQILTKALDNFGRSTTAPRQFREVLTCLVLLQRSPSIQLLAQLTGIEEQLCKTILLCLSSVLLYEHKAQEPVRLMHPSFSDFLRDANRCSVPDLVVNAEAHETLLASCSNLAIVSWARFRETRDINILDEVIIFSREILALCPPGHPGHAQSCEDIANALRTRYGETDDVGVLDEAIEFYRAVLDLRPIGHLYRATSCAYLAGSLMARYQQTGALDLLDEAIGLEREALDLRPLGHPDRSGSCTNLADSLMTRYRQTGDLTLLDESIELGREALALRPQGYPDRYGSCTNLANFLMMRYQQTGNVVLLDEAIELGREALALRPPGYTDRATSYTNLANSLVMRYHQTGYLALLDEAIHLGHEALDLCPIGHPDRSGSCTNVANSLVQRYQQTGNVGLLDEAIELGREALALRPPGYPNRSESCTNLANSLMMRSRQTGDVALLHEAIELGREALALQPAGHPDRATSCTNLAKSLMMRSRQTGDVALLHEALQCLQQSFEHGAQTQNIHSFISHVCCNAALMWDNSGVWTPQITALLVDVYTHLVDQLPSVAGFVLDTASRLETLKFTHRVGSDACVAALLAEQPATAVTLLDGAHGVVWSQALHQRDPHMEGAPKDLATELGYLLRAIAAPTPIDPVSVSYHLRDLRHGQNARIQTILREIRAMPGLARFMLGSTYETLREAARYHPVVILVAARDHSFAIIVPSSSHAGPDILRLNIANDTLQSFLKSVGRTMPEGHPSRRSALAGLWLSVVKPVLLHLGLTVRYSWISTVAQH
jgi:tetratricopeptide (TPR) repeat protein